MVRLNYGVEWPLSTRVAGRFGPEAAVRISPKLTFEVARVTAREPAALAFHPLSGRGGFGSVRSRSMIMVRSSPWKESRTAL